MPIPDFILRLRRLVGHELLSLVGTTAVVVDPEQGLLLGRRADTGNWALPSGIVEPGEEPAVAIVREVMEETGIQIVVDGLASVSTTDVVRYPNGDRSIYLDLTFTCRPIGGILQLGDDENLEVAWFPLDALPELQPSSRFRLDKGLAYDGTTWFSR